MLMYDGEDAAATDKKNHIPHNPASGLWGIWFVVSHTNQRIAKQLPLTAC